MASAAENDVLKADTTLPACILYSSDEEGVTITLLTNILSSAFNMWQNSLDCMLSSLHTNPMYSLHTEPCVLYIVIVMLILCVCYSYVCAISDANIVC